MKITHKLWALDPGYFKLKNAIKSTISFLIAVFLAYHFLGEMPAVLAGFAAIFSTQGVMDDPWQKRLLAILIMGLCSFFTYLAAALLKPHVILHVKLL